MREPIRNPILPGFNPDPSILRVGDDFYIATSTFEWFPGVQIHHSRDLVHWRLLTRPLDRTSLLEMKGNPSSGGIWAPCLSHADGLFWLVYTDVKSLDGAFKDTHNYVVTAPDIRGPWSDPVYLNSSGFDPSMFHDTDGRKWLVNMLWDFRKKRNRFAGILLQEYSPARRRLVGPIRNIFAGSVLRVTEGPHLYKKNGFYYLLTAEGGTGLHHAVTIARSRDIAGPYEIHPENPILTSRDKSHLALQKAGHASLVETQQGEWFMTHLCGRPLQPSGRCMLGRETAIQKMVWGDDGWVRLAAGGNDPQVEVPPPSLQEFPFEKEPSRDDFDGPELNIHFQTLRIPADPRWITLAERKGWLRLYGRESLSSKHAQSLVARRIQAFCCEATTCVEFSPETYLQAAGLICLYDTQNWFYLKVSHDETRGRSVSISTCDNNSYDEPVEEPPTITGPVHLRASIDHDRLQFSYSENGKEWTGIGPTFDASKLSDEYCKEGRFTGAFVGLCAQDLSGSRAPADFDYFEYLELPASPRLGVGPSDSL